MSSETSSEMNVNYLDTNGAKLDSKTEIKKQISDSTDYHYDMIANQEKIINLKESEESSEFNNIVDSEISKSSKSSKSTNSRSSSSSNKSSSTSKKSSNSTRSKPRYNNIYFNGNDASKPSTSNISIPQMETFATPQTLSPQEIRMKKIELLRRLSEIKTKGYNLTKEYDFNSSIEEMEYEYALLKSFADKRNGTKLYKNILLNGISLIEFLNQKYDPFEFKLAGWSEHMSVEIDSFDDVIEELYEKYKSSGKSTPVELRLIFLILASGAAFHYLKANSPMTQVTSGMLGKMAANNKNTSKFMSPQELNIEKQKELIREREKELKEQRKNQSNFNYAPSQPTQQSFNPTSQTFNPPTTSFNTQGSLSRNMPEIRAPDNVQEILSRIKKIQATKTNSSETQEESTINNDRLVSESTFSDNKKRGRKPKKPVISINTN